jgi:hypothetical protein
MPSPDVEKDDLAVVKERDWVDPMLNSAANRASRIQER